MSTVPMTTTDRRAEVIPPLENGDRLSREEFYRRWEAMPNLKHAERIEGIVYMQAAIRHVQHGGPHSHVVGWIVTYMAATPGTDSGDNSTLQIDLDNDPQPDAFLRILPEFGGQSGTSDDGYVEGAPEFVIEVAASSASIDLGSKLESYRRSGVREYAVWTVMQKEVKWFRRHENRFELVAPDERGIQHSEVFPGLRLDTGALVAGDIATVLADLQTGLATPEHAAFVDRLAAAKRE
jgi:Uma2 family endonuclease